MQSKIYKMLSGAKHGLFALALTVLSATAYSQVTYTFSYTGSQQTLALPAGNYSIECWGADGGKGFHTSQINNNGKGGYSFGVLTLTSSQTLNIFVGGKGADADGTTTALVAAGGFNGGGNSGTNNYATVTQYRGGAGGGASDVRVGGTGLSNRVIVAGGGGGGVYLATYLGGHGGGASGTNGGNTYHGDGGTQSAGGLANGSAGNIAGVAGVAGIGGAGGTAASKSAGGGGGGGYYGGGGGATGNTSSSQGAGGGGSGYIGGVSSGTTAVTATSGFVSNPVATGHGYMLIKELCSITLSVTGLNASGAMCANSNVTITTNAINNYTWSNGSNTSSIIVSANTNTVYGLTALSPSNCISSAQVNLVVSSGPPNLTVSQTTPSISCVGQAVTFSASGAITYTWLSGSSSGTIGNGVPYFPSASSNYTVTGMNGCGIASSTLALSINPFSVTPTSSSPTLCAGSPATLNATSAGNSYTWTPSTVSQSVVVAPGTTTDYTVTAGNGTCIATNTIQVVVIALPSLSVVSTPSDGCVGSLITLSVNGGATYTWSPGGAQGPSMTDIPVSTTQYNVVGANSSGCISSSAITVTVYPVPILNVGILTPAVCKGGQAVMTVAGADGYSWSTGSSATSITVTPTQSTMYSVTGTNTLGNCTTQQNMMINVISPAVSITGNTVICEGNTATLTASAVNAIGYQWNTGLPIQSIIVSPTITSFYAVTATVSAFNIACAAVSSIQVAVNPNPNITAITNRQLLCINESVIFSATGGNTYVWSWGTQTANGPSVTLTPTVSSNMIINVIASDANGCTGTGVVAFVVNDCTGITEGGISESVQVYPNPSQGEINVTFNSAAELLLISETGQLIRKITLNEENGFKANVSGLSSGLYFITGQNGTQSINKKVVINR